ncbi:hypothetical protein BO70DRAFT_306857 [Aspergillus heteromorphus CBS 117.55]|uniref:Uncharacterized protein n=1 Tax=Aspergillus heteromorphus CBS 117.55 TaxID=1448321 RepID=A0A317WWD6_9EURO|nr:uncharacterized protein BO70DRAFT_306857 [Aspergillus heteromorphus CBS 117.55]PWY90704.1 hypothetical protein BO70DRAFT_306857 [Aspergillus heteromorphus CBS 117.55]
MSTTTTTLSILSDYEVHHTGADSQPQFQTQLPVPAPSPPQPANWPTNHRRIPAYRPVNRHLDYNERAAGGSLGEYVFIQTMLHGVWLNATVARLWRFTGGRINDRIFQYKIGGEW